MLKPKHLLFILSLFFFVFFWVMDHTYIVPFDEENKILGDELLSFLMERNSRDSKTEDCTCSARIPLQVTDEGATKPCLFYLFIGKILEHPRRAIWDVEPYSLQLYTPYDRKLLVKRIKGAIKRHKECSNQNDLEFITKELRKP